MDRTIKVRNLIKRGKTQQAFQKFEILLEGVEQKEILDDFYLIWNQFSIYEKDKRMGMSNDETIRNKTVYGLLLLITEYEKLTSSKSDKRLNHSEKLKYEIEKKLFQSYSKVIIEKESNFERIKYLEQRIKKLELIYKITTATGIGSLLSFFTLKRNMKKFLKWEQSVDNKVKIREEELQNSELKSLTLNNSLTEIETDKKSISTIQNEDLKRDKMNVDKESETVDNDDIIDFFN